MMRSSRVREETPQPTMRVTDGSSALSMIYREETRPNMPLRSDCKHTFMQRGKQHWDPHAHATEARGCVLSEKTDSSLQANSWMAQSGHGWGKVTPRWTCQKDGTKQMVSITSFLHWAFESANETRRTLHIYLPPRRGGVVQIPWAPQGGW